MGSDSGRENEKPVHKVSISGFFMDEHPVTVGHYKRFICESGYPEPNWDSISVVSPSDLHPVVLVSWYDAMAYSIWCEKVLPTEAQWEYAARGGIAFGTYPWGDSAPDSTLANYSRQVGLTTPPKSYLPNGYGLFDMVGNVAE